ncbi:MAG: PAS domain S-box protein, partial [Symploca sp. SIO2E6]|nr:PAS domain S-box protein [Symploca sp. SIO2E6]
METSESRYRAIVEEQTELICRFSPDDKLTFVNPNYCRYFGKPYEELIGMEFYHMIPEA